MHEIEEILARVEVGAKGQFTADISFTPRQKKVIFSLICTWKSLWELRKDTMPILRICLKVYRYQMYQYH